MAVLHSDVKIEHSHRAFRGTPDVQDYVPVDSVEQEIRRLLDAVNRGDGIAVLTAAPGAGKTVACCRMQSELAGRFEAVMLSSSEFPTRRSLLQAILFELGEAWEGLTEQELRLAVLSRARRGADRRGIVLIVDEAHLLNPRLLEELRCLTNHAHDGESLIRVLLCAQLALEDLLTRPVLQALNYRITCHATLEPLSMQESAELVAGRLRHVGRPVEGLFTPEALETICRVSDGNPRCLVQICDHTLTLAAESDESPISADSVRRALRDLKQLPLQWNESAIDQLADERDAPLPVESRFNVTDDDWLTDSDSAGDSDADDRLEQPPIMELGALGEGPCDAEMAPWSSDVPTLEVGAQREVGAEEVGAEYDNAKNGWDTFETEFKVDDESEAEPILVAEPPGTVTEQQPRPAAVRERTDHAESTSANTTDDRFVEIPVDDRYAALDGQTGRSLDESVSLEECLNAPQATIDPQPRSRFRKNSDEAGTIDESEFLRIPLRLQTSERISEFDVVQPQWEEEPVIEQPPSSPGRSEIRIAEADAMATADAGPADSCPPRRPYARLFSRLRREPV